MRAVAKTQPIEGGLQVIEAPDPVAKDDYVVVRPVGCGVCGTDVSFYHWYPQIAAGYDPAWPLIMGHEFAGTVESVGGDVTTLRVGDRVAVSPHVNCGACRFCNAGRHSLCDNRRVMGCHINGGWAERVAAPVRNCHVLPADVDFSVTPLVEPLAVAMHAQERVPVAPGDTVLVMGAGTIGLLHLLLALQTGAGAVLVAGLGADRERLALAESLGGIPVNMDDMEVDTAVRRVNAGGADAAYDTTGHAHAMHPALQALRKGGQLALVGINHGTTELDTVPLVLDEKDLIGVRAYTRDTWVKCVALLPKLAPGMKRLITHTLPVTEADAAIGLVERREAIKVVLQPNA